MKVIATMVFTLEKVPHSPGEHPAFHHYRVIRDSETKQAEQLDAEFGEWLDSVKPRNIEFKLWRITFEDFDELKQETYISFDDFIAELDEWVASELVN